MLALGGASLIGTRSALAQMPAQQAQAPQRQLQPARGAQPHRIDVHHHFNTPRWVAAVATRERLNPRARDWTPAQSIDEMDRNGVAASMLSITNPGLFFGDGEATRALSRDCNEHLARLVRDHPGRFGGFAAMPLPAHSSSRCRTMPASAAQLPVSRCAMNRAAGVPHCAPARASTRACRVE